MTKKQLLKEQVDLLDAIAHKLNKIIAKIDLAESPAKTASEPSEAEVDYALGRLIVEAVNFIPDFLPEDVRGDAHRAFYAKLEAAYVREPAKDDGPIEATPHHDRQH